jgi:hypothetical protein
LVFSLFLLFFIIKPVTVKFSPTLTVSTGSEESQAGQPNSHGSLTGQTGLVSMWSSWMAAEVESRLTMGKASYGTVTTKSGAEIQGRERRL